MWRASQLKRCPNAEQFSEQLSGVCCSADSTTTRCEAILASERTSKLNIKQGHPEPGEQAVPRDLCPTTSISSHEAAQRGEACRPGHHLLDRRCGGQSP